MAKEIKERKMRPPVIPTDGIVQLDYKVIDELCKIQCTISEIAAVADCNIAQLNAAVFRDKGIVTFKEYHALKSEHGKLSLRRMMYSNAESGSTQMQVWLSKQYLGHSDKQSITSVNETTVIDGVDLTKLTDEELNQYLELSQKAKLSPNTNPNLDKETNNGQ